MYSMNHLRVINFIFFNKKQEKEKGLLIDLFIFQTHVTYVMTLDVDVLNELCLYKVCHISQV